MVINIRNAKPYTIQKNDTFGDIVLKNKELMKQLRAENPNASIWGDNGIIAKAAEMAGFTDKNDDGSIIDDASKIYAGDTIDFSKGAKEKLAKSRRQNNEAVNTENSTRPEAPSEAKANNPHENNVPLENQAPTDAKDVTESEKEAKDKAKKAKNDEMPYSEYPTANELNAKTEKPNQAQVEKDSTENNNDHHVISDDRKNITDEKGNDRWEVLGHQDDITDKDGNDDWQISGSDSKITDENGDDNYTFSKVKGIANENQNRITDLKGNDDYTFDASNRESDTYNSINDNDGVNKLTLKGIKNSDVEFGFSEDKKDKIISFNDEKGNSHKISLKDFVKPISSPESHNFETTEKDGNTIFKWHPRNLETQAPVEDQPKDETTYAPIIDDNKDKAPIDIDSYLDDGSSDVPEVSLMDNINPTDLLDSPQKNSAPAEPSTTKGNEEITGPNNRSNPSYWSNQNIKKVAGGFFTNMFNNIKEDYNNEEYKDFVGKTLDFIKGHL